MINNNDRGRQNVSVTLGTKSLEFTTKDRHAEDYYATEPKAVKLLLDMVEFKNTIWECACGEGHLSKEMIRLGYNVYSSDLINRGYGEQYDFLSMENQYTNMDIITNPPYRLANDFIVKAMSIMELERKLALFMPIRFLEGKARKRIYADYPPMVIYVSSGRLVCARSGDFANQTGGAMSYAWYVWQKGYKGNTILKWFN